MHCSCCDRVLNPNEIVFNTDINNWEMCRLCLEVSLDAAFSEGFSPGGDDDLSFSFTPGGVPDESVDLLSEIE